MTTLINNSDEVNEQIRLVQERVLTAVALYVQSRAKEYCPVDTGNLRSSIDIDVEGERATVGTNVEYALKMEKGGSKQSQAKDGYLTVAVENHITEIEELIEQYGVIR